MGCGGEKGKRVRERERGEGGQEGEGQRREGESRRGVKEEVVTCLAKWEIERERDKV